MPEALLTIRKFLFLALLYLFFFRVLRAVWTELYAPERAPAPQPARAGAGTEARGGRRSASASRGEAPLRLKVVEGAAPKGRTYDLADEVTLGRAGGCQVSLPDDTYVSQLHARVFRKDGKLFVEDLGSTNGTFLNRKPVSGPAPLRRGDRLQVGKTVLEVAR